MSEVQGSTQTNANSRVATNDTVSVLAETELEVKRGVGVVLRKGGRGERVSDVAPGRRWDSY